ncbi:MAG: peptidoglycan-binding protein [Pseudomonadota bacterium]
MSSYSSWSVKGIDDRAREVAKEQARLKGITLGDYINELLLYGHSEAGPRDQSGELLGHASVSPADPDAPSLDGLAQRIEAVEARSTLAITGIDQSVLGMLSRLESSERNTADLATNVDDLISELRDTHSALIEKVEQLETTGDNKENLDALKALERALGKLASHVYEENTLVQEETAAIKGRVETGFDDLTNRLNFVEDTVSERLKVTADKVDRAVSEASRRGGGNSEAVLRRLSEVQALVDNRVSGVEEDVVSALNHVEGTLIDVQDRLNTAEATTDTALKALEHTFAALNQRIDDVAQAADPEQAVLLRQEFEDRFENLANDLRSSVEDTREALAKEISDAALNADPQSFPALERQLTEMSGQVESQLEALAAREDQLLTTVSEKFNTLADQVDEQLAESEKRNAEAFEQVGDQVASAISRMQARHDETTARFSERLEAFGDRQDKKLSEALEHVSERMSDMQARTSDAVSPVQRAIATLAARLELVEDGDAATGDRSSLDLPEMVPFAPPETEFNDAEDSDLAFAETLEPEFEADMVDPSDMDSDDTEPVLAETESLSDTTLDYETPPESELTADDIEAPEVAFADEDGAFTETAPETDAPQDGDDEAALALSIAARVGAMAGGSPFAPPDSTADEEPEIDAGASELDAETSPEDEDFVAGIPGLEDGDALADEPDVFADAVDPFEDSTVEEEERLPTDDTELAVWNPSEDTEPEDPIFDEPEADLAADAEGPVFDDPFEFDDADDSVGDDEDVTPQAFAEDFDAADSDDPEDVFGGWDDGRDEARESDVFEGMEASTDEGDLAFEDFEGAEDVTAFDETSDDVDPEVAAATEDDLVDEDEATNYLDRARNAAIRATNDKSTRFRAHQAGQGGVDRFSAGDASPRKRMPILLAGAALMVTAAAAAGYITLRDDLLASDTSFDIQTGPVSAAVEDVTPVSAALDEVLAETEADEFAGEAESAEATPSETLSAENVSAEVEPIAAPDPIVETPTRNLPQIEIPNAVSIDQAIENGNAVAQYQQGARLLQAGDISAGVALIQQAAGNGLAVAEYRLAKLHEEGLGVPRDLGEARVWTERAAEGGNADAMHDLAVFYAEGEAGLQSYAAAAKWFRNAADFGLVDSQYNLALLYENGLGISPSDEEAVFWYEVAARNGDGSAPGEVRRISASLDPGTVADVQARAEVWRSAEPVGAENGVFGEQVWEASQKAQLLAVQTGLNTLGYEAGVPDGIFGAGTRQAIRAFQADEGLTPDGRLSNATISAMRAKFGTGG